MNTLTMLSKTVYDPCLHALACSFVCGCEFVPGLVLLPDVGVKTSVVMQGNKVLLLCVAVHLIICSWRCIYQWEVKVLSDMPCTS